MSLPHEEVCHGEVADEEAGHVHLGPGGDEHDDHAAVPQQRQQEHDPHRAPAKEKEKKLPSLENHQMCLPVKVLGCGHDPFKPVNYQCQ